MRDAITYRDYIIYHVKGYRDYYTVDCWPQLKFYDLFSAKSMIDIFCYSDAHS